jgi:hypothetical protein
MNYLDNEQCFEDRGEFTCGQRERMIMQWALYREQVDSCGSSEMEIEILIRFGDQYSNENAFYLEDANGYVIFNSTSDYDYDDDDFDGDDDDDDDDDAVDDDDDDDDDDHLLVDLCGKCCL